MIKKTNKRVIITMTEKQVELIDHLAKQYNISRSKVIKRFIENRLEDILGEPSRELLVKIASTKWLD